MATATSAVKVRPKQREGPTAAQRVREIISYLLLFALAAMFLYPFLYAVLSSFKPLPELAANPARLWPQEWVTDGYNALRGFNVGRWMINSALIATIVTIGTVLFASMAGYALARIRFRGAGVLSQSLIGMMMVPPIVLLIPMFIILKFLGLVDTYGGLIFPKLVTLYGIFLMTQFYKAIPKELEEAAFIDGANRWQIFTRVVLPLTRPALVALVIATFQGNWNEFLHPLIVVTVNNRLYTLPLGLALLRGNMGQNLHWNVLMAGSMLTTLPMALIFVFFQRYFIEGVSYSGIKG
jgi:multiple sugar transport system permease protein